MIKKLTSFWRDECGATLVEYGIALVIAIGVGAALLGGLAGNVTGQFNSANQAITDNQPAPD